MISHGNIISNFNKSAHRSGLGLDDVSLRYLHWVTRLTHIADRKDTTA